MSAPSEAGSTSSDEDIDGLIAAVLQDIEIQDAINEGRGEEGDSDHDGKTVDTKDQTHHNYVQNPSDIDDGDQNQPPLPPSHTPPIPKDSKTKPKLKRISISIPDAKPNAAVTTPIVEKENKRLVDTQIALTKITSILREVDEDNDGEVDYEEFGEALRLIDSNLNHIEIEEIYQHFVYNDDDELCIQLFVNLLQQRCKGIGISTEITPKTVLKSAFKFIKTPLNKIYDTLREKDEDDNLCIDWSEFEEAMIDLEVNMPQSYLQSIYCAICKQQNHKELNIKLFMKDIAATDHATMNYADILKQYFTALLPPHIHRIRSRKHRKKKRKKVKTMSDMHRICGAALHTKTKKKAKKQLQRKPHLRDFNSMTRFNSMSLLSMSSILNKSNCGVIVMNALRRELREVDDNEDGSVDCAEFIEALSTLKSSINAIKAAKMFHHMTLELEGELAIDAFVNEIQEMFIKYPTITGDECIEKVALKHELKCQMHHRSMNTMNSLSSIYSMQRSISTRSVLSVQSMQCMDEEKDTDSSTVKQIQEIVNLCDPDENGTVDREEFIDILSEWGIDEKFKKNELFLIFNALMDGDSEQTEEASCHLFMRRVQEVQFDHPNYSPRRAVYRVCRRLLKDAYKQTN